MKRIVVLWFFICGCGESNTAPTAENVIAPSPTPSPTPKCEAVFVGNWVDSKNTDLIFNSDCSAAIGSQKLTWSLNDNHILFSLDKTEIDLCGYQITANGGLNSPIEILLSLSCAKSGSLSYTKKN